MLIAELFIMCIVFANIDIGSSAYSPLLSEYEVGHFSSNQKYVKNVDFYDQMEMAKILTLSPTVVEFEKPVLSNKGLKVLEQLVDAVNDLSYKPVVVLIDDTEQVHRDANLFMQHILNIPYITTDFLLMEFNNTGVTKILADSSKNKLNFFELLKRQDTHILKQTTALLAPTVLQGSVVFYAILHATRTLPKETAIIVFTDRRADDEDLAHLAVHEMLNKIVKLYVVWGGIYPTTKKEEKLLKESAELTGGQFLIGNTERKASDLYSSAYITTKDAKQTKAVIANYSNMTEPLRLLFPINSDVTSFHISITSSVTAVRLISPKGLQINLLNTTEVEDFSEGSFRESDTTHRRYEIQLNTNKNTPTPTVGIWRLEIGSGELHAQPYDVTVSAQTHLNVAVHIDCKTGHDDFSNTKTKSNDVLCLSISGDIEGIQDISFLSQSGALIKGNVTFHKHNKQVEFEEMTTPKQDIAIDFKELPNESFYLKVLGTDTKGSSFARLSYFEGDHIGYVKEALSVEVGAGSELLVMPNKYGKIFFEVTNNKDQVMYVHFMVQDERSLLLRMEPRQSWLNPKQTIIVTVTTYVPNVAIVGYKNLITFTVSGPERVQKRAAMYVTTNEVIDEEEPRLTHRYSSDCTNILLGNCQDGSWVIEVTAKDEGSGLLQLTSNPKGLYFPNGYIAGTKESVVGLYGGSCCQSKIQLTAIDMQNNRKSYTADAYYATWSAGSISAIVLGIILFIILIILIVCLCKAKCCKQKESIDLPTYRGPHGSQRRY